ncbi:hypothetical protein AMELA_G00182120 [Ameiurus melas]|uniref:Uncharacterized protein n=1 Tax=Ameiurus melas TaxID=219545 RepID=A0A7J6AA40_AMEME|nr:hypothetical protein AMELA_G00182120 [Ameiurus melas]
MFLLLKSDVPRNGASMLRPAELQELNEKSICVWTEDWNAALSGAIESCRGHTRSPLPPLCLPPDCSSTDPNSWLCGHEA